MAAENNKYIYGSVAEKVKSDIYGSAAEKAEINTYDPYEENAVLKSKKIARNNSKLKTKIIFYILIIFSMCAFTMFRYAQISQINIENHKLNKQYVEIQKENELLSIEIENARSLNNIREVAKHKLNMDKPSKSQIIYVNIPKEDVTMVASNEPSKAITMFKNAGDSIKRFLNIFY